ncbi:hypothetical protein [Rhizobacter sp. SG703]|uniref:hypothetical protein n=1 Tax=Rhizobacter sp. SG703 TaxID=2587140 RepID=UPI001444A731|nr:hypothetical protein [Rhizobacter sp. SG703]NKI96638.1 type II secretory pathway pseudopilin PulG [Rhizobacter sp. SG703]
MDALTVPASPPTPQYCLLWLHNWDAVCMPRSDWASWMQAFAAVVALAIAVGVPLLQHRHAEARAEESRLREEERVLSLFISLVREVHIQFHRLYSTAQNNQNLTIAVVRKSRSALIRALDSLESVPLQTLSNAYSVNVVIDVIDRTHEAIEKLGGGVPVGPLVISTNGVSQAHAHWRAEYAAVNDDFQRMQWALRAVRDPSDPPPGQ